MPAPELPELYGTEIPGVRGEDLGGWLIVIEGTDGVGRSTHVDRLRDRLQRMGYAVAEPDDRVMADDAMPWAPARRGPRLSS